MGLSQIRFDNGTSTNQPIWVRFVNSVNNESLGDATEAFNINNNGFQWRTPPAPVDTKAIMEISYN